MSRKEYGLILVVALIAGLVGGVVSSWLFIDRLTIAQKTLQQATVIRAERFEAVDRNGNVRALLEGAGGPFLSLDDAEGYAQAFLGVTSDGASWLALNDNRRTRAVLGATELETLRPGSTEKRPVSSLVLFDKEGNVIWKAP